jgi:hypothetical protein
MQSVRGWPIKTIKKATAKLMHEMVRAARFGLGAEQFDLWVRPQDMTHPLL